MEELRAVEVTYEVRRTVYIYAGSDSAARGLARDTSNWADEGDPSEPLNIRVPRNQVAYGES